MTEQRDISRITASGVLGEFNYDVNFDEGPKRLRAIYAPNGRGKTNFLRAVAFALNPAVDSLQALIEIPIRSLVIEFRSGAILQIARKDAFSATYTATATPPDRQDSLFRGEDELLGSPLPAAQITVEPADFSSRLYRRVWDERGEYARYQKLVSGISNGSALMGDDRLALADDGRDAPRQTISAAERKRQPTVARALERVERMLTQGALDSLSRDSAASEVYVQLTRTTFRGTKSLPTSEARRDLEDRLRYLTRRGSAYERYGLLSLRQVRQIRAEINHARANDRNFPTLHRILKPYLESLRDQMESLNPALELIDTFVTAVNSFLDRKKLEFLAGQGVKLRDVRNGSLLHPDSLSSGERHLLLLLSIAIIATEDRPLVIVDEPEISLGLDWQRKLLEQLLRCSSSANVQFLIASHSTQIMGNIPDEDIIQPSEEA